MTGIYRVPQSTTEGQQHTLRTWLAAITVAASLAACDNSTIEPEPEQIAEEVTNTSVTRAGAHGAGNPHANLSPDKHARVALQHLAEGRRALAIETLDQAIIQYPDFAQLHAIRGSLRLEDGEVAAALVDLEAAVKLAPENPQYRVNRAQAYRQFDRFDEAMTDLQQAIEIDPDLLSARFNRGALAFEQGDLDTALADFDTAVALAPHAAAPYFNRAAVHDALGNREQAVTDIERFIQISPSEEWTETANQLLTQWNATEAGDGTTETQEP